ncbi:NUDIX hydrolase [Actinocorallia longicatena]|uniref:Nudix hydrolase domain-containing protein n=1 Tax=Actinocorallia longicatena TaxID=111803 RepID=A0ABP6PUV4_9ACTN
MDPEYLATLPRTRGAAAALLLDEQDRILLVKPTYKDGWSLPGGVIELGESPLAACVRECAEELGLVPRLNGILCYDWAPPTGPVDATNVWVFGGIVTADEVARIVLPPDELSAHRLARPDELGELLPPHVARRVTACLDAAGPLYLENGLLPTCTSEA